MLRHRLQEVVAGEEVPPGMSTVSFVTFMEFNPTQNETLNSTARVAREYKAALSESLGAAILLAPYASPRALHTPMRLLS